MLDSRAGNLGRKGVTRTPTEGPTTVSSRQFVVLRDHVAMGLICLAALGSRY